MQHPFFDRRQSFPQRGTPQPMRQSYHHQHDYHRRMRGRGVPVAPLNQNQRPTGSRTAFIKKAFTSEDGSFDVSRTAATVDQVIKTVQQVSPYVRKVGSFFIK